MIIGVTGKNCAGKDTVADHLVTKGYEKHSLSDALREELRARGVEVTRDSLVALGNELRAAEGPATLAKRILGMVRSDRAAIVSVRNPAEVAALRARAGFFLLGVDAPLEQRYAREVARGREGAAESLEVFTAQEERENSADPNGQQLDAVLGLADETVMNDGTIPELHQKLDALLERLDG